ncbi:MAG: hypothetical protein U1U88_000754 [Lawsonella clevelandensis]
MREKAAKKDADQAAAEEKTAEAAPPLTLLRPSSPPVPTHRSRIRTRLRRASLLRATPTPRSTTFRAPASMTAPLPKIWFATEEDAEAAGYEKPKSQQK